MVGSQSLINELENEGKLNINRFFTFTDTGFKQWEVGPHLARIMFQWLDEKGYLSDYIRNVSRKGYGMEVLEEATGTNKSKMNMELKRFIETDCKAATKIAQAVELTNESDSTASEQALKEALNIKSEYPEARLALAKLYFKNKQYQLCRNYIKPITIQSASSHYLPAVKLIAKSYSAQKDYNAALEYYEKAWDVSEYYFYRYQIAYNIACCHHYLDHVDTASDWFQKFLNFNYQLDNHSSAIEYAKSYIEIANL